MVNEEALSVMRQAALEFNVYGAQNRQILAEEYTTDMMLGILAILGSPNMASKARSPLDHSSEIGFRMIDRVVMLRLRSVLSRQTIPKSLETIAIFWRDPVLKRASRIESPQFFSGRLEDIVGTKKEVIFNPNHPPCLHRYYHL